jgi:membrane protease YdiL (CAAX protease family)
MGSSARRIADKSIYSSLLRNSSEIFEFLAVFSLTCFQPFAFHLYEKVGPASTTSFIFGIPSAIAKAYIFWIILNRDKNWSFRAIEQEGPPIGRKVARRLGQILLGLIMWGATCILSMAARGFLSDLPKEATYWSPEYYQSLTNGHGFIFLSLILSGVHVVTEEIVFRAYFIHKLKKLCRGNLWLPVIISSALFSLKHGYGYKGTVDIFISGLVYALGYISTGSLLPSYRALDG